MVGLFGSLTFAGLLVGSILITRLSDVFGRKPVLVTIVISSSVFLLGIIVVPNVYGLYIFLFLFGCTVASRFAIVYIYA